MASKRIKGITIELGAETTGLDKALSGIEKNSRSVASELKEVENLLKFNPDNTEALRQKQELLGKQVGLTADKLDVLKRAESQVQDQFAKGDIKEEQYRAFQREIVKTESQLKNLEAKVNGIDDTKAPQNLKDDMGKIGTSAQDAGDDISGMADIVAGGALQEMADKAQAVIDKFVEIGKQAYELGLSGGDSITQIQAALGVSEEYARTLADTANDVFKNGIVESAEEATDAIVLVAGTFGDLNETEIGNVTNQLAAISKRTGTDVAENIRGVDKLMGAFGLTAEEALDLVAAGYQNNLNVGGDFTDTLNEYAPLFSEAGYSASEMFMYMQTGMANGAMNTDKVADSIKEMQIRMGDGTFEGNLDKFSEGTGNLFYKWQSGEATMSEVMNSIGEDMKQLNPTEQQALLTVLGTQFEDLGLSATTALLGVNQEYINVNGSADEMAQKSPSENINSSLRELQDLLAPLGESLVELVEDGLNYLIDAIQSLIDWYNNLSPTMQTVIQFVGLFTGAFLVLLPIVMTIIGVIMAVKGVIALMGGALGAVLGPIALVAAAIAAAILIFKNWDAIVAWVKNALQSFGAKASEIFNSLRSKVSEVWGSIKSTFSEFGGNVLSTARDTFDRVLGAITSPIERARDKVSGIVDRIKGLFNFQLSFPSIKLPHFSLRTSTKSILGKEFTFPTGFDVEWYANGGILTKPTAFGMNGNSLMVGGEAGREAVLPLNEKTLGGIGKGIAQTMNGGMGTVIVPVVLDGKEIARVTAPYMNNELGRLM